ncbi:MAG: class I SAM-dependent methyltransferase [Alphaproteobacteria bacterium]|nr:class I SAM-dependent methyltransferase [Alphaproteobacteria bacterium]MDP6515409.1 class I SAM-dependent methyltransferase [Alphaproteobacteria bacterium]
MEHEARRFWNHEFFPRFREIAYRHGETPDCPYPFYEIRRRHVLQALRSNAPGRLLDVGCGGGHVLEPLRAAGWDCEGCDFAPNMVAFADQRLDQAGFGDVTIREAFATAPPYESASVDVLLCLGPIEYLDAEEAARAYGEARRILRPGGTLVCAHINQLFDLFTLDGFTADLMTRLVRETGSLAPGQIEDLTWQLRARLGCDSAAGDGATSIRRQVQTRADNPLTIGAVLSESGFTLADILFYRFYAAPPFVYRQRPELEAQTIAVEDKLAHDWRGHFLASSFLTVSRRR